jgi:hypothetical protein
MTSTIAMAISVSSVVVHRGQASALDRLLIGEKPFAEGIADGKARETRAGTFEAFRDGVCDGVTVMPAPWRSRSSDRGSADLLRPVP